MVQGSFSRWVKNNAVVLVVVPLIGAIHWGWYELQKVPYLVPPSERKAEMPIVRAFKEYKTRFVQKIEDYRGTPGSEE